MTENAPTSAGRIPTASFCPTARRLSPTTRPSGRPRGPDLSPGPRQSLEAQNLDPLLDFEHKAPSARLAHPRTKHFAPLFAAPAPTRP
jgi:hypothetical protein